jgi:metalloendopeptidase OMA1, mitochondrial
MFGMCNRREFGIGLGSALMLSMGCRTVPVTGRKQLMFMPVDQEIAMADQAFQEVVASEKPSADARTQDIVNRVGSRIAAVAQRPDFKWDFRLFESETQNAFALPGGKVAVYQGIIPICQHETGLAVVMSHEIAHTIARHGSERVSQQSAVKSFQSVLGYAVAKQSDLGQRLIMTSYGAASQYGFLLPYSRKHELEADRIGLQLMAQAGYDPAEAPRFWERFAAASSGAQPPVWASTHPSDATRSQQLALDVPAADQLYQAAPIRVGLGEVLLG